MCYLFWSVPEKSYLELEFQAAVSHLTWVLGMQLCSLNHPLQAWGFFNCLRMYAACGWCLQELEKGVESPAPGNTRQL